VLIGQGEELAHRLGTDSAHRLEQAFHHGTEHFIGLQVQRRQGQTGVAAVQDVCTQQSQPTNRAGHQGPDNRFGRRIAGQRVQVALHDGGGRFFGHDEEPNPMFIALQRIIPTAMSSRHAQ
jgi:hypothetical protein